MKTFKLEITCDNDAFGIEPGHELSRILFQVAENALYERLTLSLYDMNGNLVGHCKLEEKP